MHPTRLGNTQRLSPSLALVLFMVFVCNRPVTLSRGGRRTFATRYQACGTEQTSVAINVSPPGYGDLRISNQQEPYAEAPGGQRTVQYFDKSRMEVNNPNGDRSSQWFITNGLLSKELITGQMQTGDNTFESRYSADIPVAGDPDDANGPTYATLSRVLGPYARVRRGHGDNRPRGQREAARPWDYMTMSVRPETGKIPRCLGLLELNGVIDQYGQTSRLRFDPPSWATDSRSLRRWGHGEGRWGRKVVLCRAERRVLTYTPTNAQGWW